jgi:hypothetical protein
MIKKILGKVYKSIFQRSLPRIHLITPSVKENELIKDLRIKFHDIPDKSLEKLEPSALSWANNMNRLKALVLNNDPRKFLDWDVIRKTMYIGNSGYIRKEYKYLKSISNFSGRWYPAIQESTIGLPKRYNHLGRSSGNLIHHAYHIAKFEEETNLLITNSDFVFEFGGGYGSMCRLFHNLGYKKRYLIFDLAPFSALQKYYLKSLGLEILDIDNFIKAESGILCISKIEDLQIILKNSDINQSNSLFLGTWSISETPVNLREIIFPLVKDFSSFLIAYQNNFCNVDNIDYFDNFRKQHKNISWNNWEIPHLPGNNYLIGNL